MALQNGFYWWKTGILGANLPSGAPVLRSQQGEWRPDMANPNFPTTAAGTFGADPWQNVKMTRSAVGAFGSWKAE